MILEGTLDRLRHGGVHVKGGMFVTNTHSPTEYLLIDLE